MASSVRSTESYYKGGKNKALNLKWLSAENCFLIETLIYIQKGFQIVSCLLMWWENKQNANDMMQTIRTGLQPPSLLFYEQADWQEVQFSSFHQNASSSKLFELCILKTIIYSVKLKLYLMLAVRLLCCFTGCTNHSAWVHLVVHDLQIMDH